MPKNQYHGKDFFQRQEFRGLFLADNQEALGQKAFKCVDELNSSTVSKFNQVSSFKDSIGQKKTQENFYKTNTTMKSFMNKTYKTTNFQGKSQTAGINQSPRSRSPNQSKFDNRLEGAA